MTYYERNLPHWHPPGASIFLTWRLHGSLPATLFPHQRAKSDGEPFGQAFRRMDAALDRAARGPAWLKERAVAECVTVMIERGASEFRRYRFHAFVVMANHVHLLITPLCPVARLANSLKGTSARECNKILGRTWSHFWQDESFDHWIRTTGEFTRIRTYMEQNPVTAALVGAAEEWPWSSASRKSAIS